MDPIKIQLNQTEVEIPEKKAVDKKKSGEMESEPKDEFGLTERLRIAIGIKYNIQSLIGKGSYGLVSLATYKQTGR